MSNVEMAQLLAAFGEVKQILNSVLEGQQMLDAKIEALRIELKAEIARTADELRAEFKADIDNLRTELKAEIAAVRTELKAEIAAVRSELKAEIAAVRTEVAELKTEVFKLKGETAEVHAELKRGNRRFDKLEDSVDILILEVHVQKRETHRLKRARFLRRLAALKQAQ